MTSIFDNKNEIRVLDFVETAQYANVVHISTHNNRSGSPISPGHFVLLNKINPIQLYYEVLAHIKFNCHLLFLNSCESGSILSNSSKGSSSLFTALGTSNIKYILGTIWNVNDFAAEIFSKIFYSYLIDGVNPVIATSMTKKLLIQSKEFSNPIFWAPYIIYTNL